MTVLSRYGCGMEFLLLFSVFWVAGKIQNPDSRNPVPELISQKQLKQIVYRGMFTIIVYTKNVLLTNGILPLSRNADNHSCHYRGMLIITPMSNEPNQIPRNTQIRSSSVPLPNTTRVCNSKECCCCVFEDRFVFENNALAYFWLFHFILWRPREKT